MAFANALSRAWLDATWQKPGNSLAAFRDCKPMVVSMRGDLLAQERSVGQIDGYTTFSTSQPGIGVQYRIHDSFGTAHDIKGNGKSSRTRTPFDGRRVPLHCTGRPFAGGGGAGRSAAVRVLD
ncbi:hypothetical protein G6F59_016452 [Rhizopus arrhizus]|nr:hypothetical protein G6F59_016452 [Rhizopus arrhizus]